MFAHQLKAAMQERNMTQTELSLKAGLSKSCISQYLSGVLKKPGASALKSLAAALGKPVEYFAAENNQECKILEKLTNERIYNIPVSVASKLMGKSSRYVEIGLQRGVLPIGYAVKTSSHFSYYISPKLFADVTGIDVNKLIGDKTQAVS